MNTQTLVEDLWVPLLLGVGVFLIAANRWKRIDPGQKLTKKDYRILVLFSAFMTWFLYVIIFHKYASRLWDFSVVGFVSVVLLLGGLLVWLISRAVRTAMANPNDQ